MRPVLMLLAVLAAGIGGDERQRAIAPADGGRHKITAGETLDHAPSIEPGTHALSAAPGDRAAAGAGCRSGRVERQRTASAPQVALAARDAAARACMIGHRHYTSRFALARAGLVSCPRTAPPSFRII